MKIKLIAPARKAEWGESFWDVRTLCKLTGIKASIPPLALLTLAALTPADIEVVLTDENIEPIDFDEKVDLVGITGMTSFIPRAYEIAAEFKKRAIPVVMGGIHASMLPEEAIQHCDSVVIGEAEEIWEHTVRDAQKMNLQKFYRAPRFPDLANSPIPRWDLLKNDKYLHFIIQTGRGCPYDCDFCSVKVFNGRQYRHRRIERVIEEIETLQKIDNRKMIFFSDDNLLAVPSYAEQLLEKLIPLKIRSWMCQSSVNRLNNDGVLDLMHKAGCRSVFVGFESVSQKSLEVMNKGQVNKVAEYKEIVHKVHSHRISVFGSFILGSDADEESIFEKTAEFIDETNIGFSMINILTPPPGTRLYQNMENEKRILHKDWQNYNAENVCIKPRFISADTLQEKRGNLVRQIYSYDRMYKRFSCLWSKGVFTRKNKSLRGLFTKLRLLLSFKIISQFQGDRMFFALKCLWNRHVPAPTLTFAALSYHDYAKNITHQNHSQAIGLPTVTPPSRS
ncbi:MAG: radical SAM protein [Elusimicrobiota bacterium]|jgi:radical SAM superfamily enzyme YgiQ (UPF0313 family)